jgi:sigma-B regulation protein RsbU (phosphoserine phosphatase)
VSGHGTPAAVMMAITHSIAHQHPGPPTPPGTMLAYLNQQLATRYTAALDSFVTAFYGIYDPATRRLVYSSAGHNPPRLKRTGDGPIASLDGAQRLPLGIVADQSYGESSHVLEPGDKLVFFTDGITDSQNASGESFGAHRLDKVLATCTACTAEDLVAAIRKAVDEFAGDEPPIDDRTLLSVRVL